MTSQREVYVTDYYVTQQQHNHPPRVAPYDYTITVKYKAKVLNITAMYFCFIWTSNFTP